MRWAITGGCGFIGRALIESLIQENGHKIRVLDDLSVGKLADLKKIAQVERKHIDSKSGDGWSINHIELFTGSICDNQIVDSFLDGADVVVHLAANTGVQPSIIDPLADCQTNIIGTVTMLQGCRTHKIKRFVLASSGAPLGSQEPPLHEELAPHPVSPYGASKLAGEAYCSAYYHSFGIQAVSLRFGNVYGIGSELKSSVVAKFIKRALEGKSLYINGDGSQTRDFIYISDLVNAIKLAATKNNIGGETFQIATAKETSIIELMTILKEVFASHELKVPKVEFGKPLVGDVMRNFSDTRKAKRILSWSPEIDLKTGLDVTLKSFLENV